LGIKLLLFPDLACGIYLGKRLAEVFVERDGLGVLKD
jgi:hypothetical protein